MTRHQRKQADDKKSNQKKNRKGIVRERGTKHQMSNELFGDAESRDESSTRRITRN